MKAQRPQKSPLSPAFIRKVQRTLQKREIAQRRHRERYGEVDEPISTKAFGFNLVAVRNRIYSIPEGEYFADFLRWYALEIMASEWWNAEMMKPEVDRHLVVQWLVESDRYMSTQPKQLDGSRKAVPSGTMSALLTFAYDLYIVDHHCGLDDLFLNRLRNRDLFQGARHELFAQATCVRAGCTIELEDEQDGRRRHAEFTAIHKRTGQRLSVEAKSKHYAGVLGARGQAQPHDHLNLRFAHFINAAVRKKPSYPLVIFIDTNLPFDLADRLLTPQSKDVPSRYLTTPLMRIKRQHDGKDPFCMIIFTNHPDHYAARDEREPRKHLTSVLPDDKVEDVNQNALWALHKAANLYGNIPNEFPSEKYS